MTIHETTDPSAHPYRSAVEPCTMNGDGLRVPYTGQARMRLAVSSGLAHGRIEIDPEARDLIAIRCGEGPPPRLRVVAGEIALSRRVSFGEWLRDVLRPCDHDLAIVLHPAVEWTLAIRGGLAHFELDLAAGRLARLDIHGGCADARFELPLPETAVPIRVAGGACRLLVQRPARAGVVLAATGGMSALRLDDQRFDAIGGAVRLASRDLEPGAPGYELQISGGAADLAIERGARTGQGAGNLDWL
jgi:hypothetical protein